MSTRRVRQLSLILLFGCLAPFAGCGGDAPAAASRSAPRTTSWTGPMAEIGNFEQLLRDASLYSGGKWDVFETVGRNTFATAINNGLDPDDVVVDIGAGSLRVGWWFLHFIEPSNYHAVDPDRDRLDQVVEMLGVDIHRYYNDDFRFPDVDVDFVISRSIWTHASKAMITTMLNEFSEHATADGVFLTSVLLARTAREDYMGDEWIGKGSAEGLRVVRHSLEWIEGACNELDLELAVQEVHNDHTWLVITRR